jgi:AraC family transcriptional regulator
VLHIAFPWREVQDFVELPEEEAVRRMHSLARAPFEEPVLNTVAWRLWAASGHKGHAENLFIEHALHLLLATLLLRSSDECGAVASGERLAPWQLRRAQEFMRSRLGEPIRLAEIARTAGLSQHHFLRAYKRSTGQTPFLWFTQQRIERAKELMARRDLPLTEIAYALGFSSLGHFSTTFRCATGMTPTIWRHEWIDRQS